MFKRFFFNRRHSYSRWDGSQQIEGLDADEIMRALSDDYLRDGDLQKALQRMQQSGFQNRDGQHQMGLRDIMDRLRQQQQQRLQRYNLSGVMDDIREKLESVKQHEREGIQRRLDETSQQGQTGNTSQQGQPGDSGQQNQPGDPSQQGRSGQPGESGGLPPGLDPQALRRALEQIAQRKRDFLDGLPRDPGGQIRELSNYDFMDAGAREEFQELLQMLQQQIMQQYFQGMQQAISQMTPEDLARMREMIRDLNQMLRDREQGREPDFDSFMQKYGDYFGDNVNTLDDLIEDLQQRMAAMDAIMDSLPEDQRRQLQEMMEQIVGDDRLRVDLAELSQHIAQQGPNEYRTRFRFQGDESVSLTEAMSLMGELQGLDELESQMNTARRRNDLDQVDSEATRRLLGEEDAAALDALKQLMKELEDAGYITRDGNRWQLTSVGIRKIGQKALQDMFEHLDRDAFGNHKTDERGVGGERLDETKPYVFGDPFLMDLHGTLMNAIERQGPGAPVKLTPDDFDVYRTELITASSTVLMIDMSMSMFYSGSYQAAKKVAVALEALIRGQFPHDNLYVVGFNSIAREFKRDELVSISEMDHSQGTNMVHGLMLARQLLNQHKGVNRQVIMVTDGGPTMLWDKESQKWLFTYPYTQIAQDQTLLEVNRCTKDNIRINTFMLVHDPSLIDFVQEMSAINKGRAFITSPDDLGQYLLVDYLASKQVFRR